MAGNNRDFVLKNYKCDGQIDLFDYLEQLNKSKVCSFSGHTCNKKNLWEVADSLDELQCPHVCCRKCNTRNCGARCNGSEEPQEPIYKIEIVGICDDARCPNCGCEFWENEVDVERCPQCNVRLTGWELWHRINDEEDN